MKLLFNVKTVVLIFAFILISCGGGGSGTGGGKERRISNIGDSISTGFNRASPWPPRLASILNIPVSNNARDGEQTSFGLSIIEGVIAREKPTDLTIMLGTNDALRGSVPVAIANLQAMVNIANARGVKVFVATLPPITNNAARQRNADLISNGIRGLSGATIVDVRAAMGDGQGLLADGVHPNDRGQELIANTFANALR